MKAILFFMLGLFSFTHIQAQYIFDNEASLLYADSVMGKLTQDEKIAQLFMIYVETDWSDANLRFYHKQIQDNCPGGLILFGGGPTQAKHFVSESQQLAKVPLLIGVDGEYGLGMRMDSFPKIPFNMVLGAIRDNRIVVEAGRYIGSQCRAIDAHMNFMPVLDVNNNPANPVINYRSFGEDVRNVMDKGYAISYGMQQYGIVSVGKHFPGHGNTNVDSHQSLPVISGNYKQLMQTEMKPFFKLQDRGLDAVMVGHLKVPGLDNSGLPATLSKRIVSDVLKDSLSFNGLIITDGMNMGAVTKGFSQPFVKAIQAGNDILLLPAVYSIAFNEVKQAVLNGALPMQTVEDRCRRILQAKYQIIVQQPKSNIPQKNVEALKHKIYSSAITVLRNKDRQIPFSDCKGKRFALIENEPDSEFENTLSFYKRVDYFAMPTTKAELDTLKSKLANYREIIVGLHGNITSSKGNYKIKNDWFKMAGELANTANVHLVLMANPYALRGMSVADYAKMSSVIVGYDNDPIAQTYCAQVLFGGIPAVGKLSVSILPHAKAGFGLFTQKLRIGMECPELQGMHANLQDSISEIVDEAIKMKAMPGCQILVAKNGNIVFNKSYGYHTYKLKQKVKNSDLYDVASVTKIAVTMPILMEMDELGELSINNAIGEYLPRLKNTNKEDIRIRDILRHTSGLRAHIPFQYVLIDPSSVKRYGMFSYHKTNTFRTQVDTRTYLSKYAKPYKNMVVRKPDKDHQIKVANKYFVHNSFIDTIRSHIDSSKVQQGNPYRYSDLGFFYMKEIIENVRGTTIDKLAEDLYFKPLGMSYSCFNPLTRFDPSRIVPTENDHYFRKQLVHGYVHDQAAALMGGVAGHAGLFSNAGDLAKLFQMFLNGGSYGGKDFLDWNTIHYYTTNTEGTGRRAIGFDKPEPDPEKVGPTCSKVSLASYGHSGFTGTYVWVDPAYDLIYIFLSNRIHPDVWNTKLVEEDIRTRIQERIYNCIL